jgi:uridine kinase
MLPEELEKARFAIEAKRRETPASRAVLVGISGIDASGKGYVTEKLKRSIDQAVAVINVDQWLNIPAVRFTNQPGADPGRHFYENAIRFDEMLAMLVLPLKLNRSVNITADYAEETAEELRPRQYLFNDVAIILLDGIFLFKRQMIHHFDLKIWVECSFENALRRAVSRRQESLSPEETIRAYEGNYFPAQRVHFQLDQPQITADLIIDNN